MLRRIAQILQKPMLSGLQLGRASSSFSQRSHVVSELTPSSHGEPVSISGWVHSIRFNGKFLLLRDSSGIVQVVVPHDLRDDLPTLESVIRVNGIVQHRPDNRDNKQMASGAIEIIADDVEVLNLCEAELPIYGKDVQEASETVRNRFRYLDLRRPVMNDKLQLRSKVILAMRRFLCEYHGFVDVETPTLFRRTPGGAREFVVPTRFKNRFYSLVQSPQQFKQLLMVAGVDRYMQVARCYRDEDSRSDRQPEFTQLDIEMSFVSKDDVCELIEDLLTGIWPVLHSDTPPMVPGTPFPRLSYQEAMMNYGSDKPDLRFDLFLRHILSPGEGVADSENTASCIVVPDHLFSLVSKRKWKDLERDLKSMEDGEIEVAFSYPASKDKGSHLMRGLLMVEDEDLTVIATGGTDEDRCSVMGRVRLKIADFLCKAGVSIYRNGFHFAWIEDFPLFTKEKGVLTSTHHPFTAPLPQDKNLVFTNPETVRGQHYDLVCNGVEVGGGSIRIHDSELQRHILKEVLKEDDRHLSHLIEALKHGCPPHGGIALGLDRLLALIMRSQTIRDVIAFPKLAEGRDLMSGAPSEIDKETKNYYNLD